MRNRPGDTGIVTTLLDSSCLGGRVGVQCRSGGYPLPPYPSTRVQAQRLPPTPLLTGLQIAVTVVLSDSVTPSPHALPPLRAPAHPLPPGASRSRNVTSRCPSARPPPASHAADRSAMCSVGLGGATDFTVYDGHLCLDAPTS